MGDHALIDVPPDLATAKAPRAAPAVWRYVAERGTVQVAIPAMARTIGQSAQATSYAVHWLRDHGWLTVERTMQQSSGETRPALAHEQTRANGPSAYTAHLRPVASSSG